MERTKLVGEGVVTPWDSVEVDALRAWRCLLGTDGRWQGRTWFQSDGFAFPRLTETQPPDQDFFELVGQLIAAKTHPRVLLPPPILGAGTLRRVRQAELRDWISGQGYESPAACVPFAVIEKLVKGDRDRGPIGNVDADPRFWVTAAVSLIGHLTIAKFCDAQPKQRPDQLPDPRFLRRQLRDVQARLADVGVLPWAAFQDAVVPPDWQTHAAMDDARQQWHEEANAIDAMTAAIDGIVAGLGAFEVSGNADLARAVLRGHLRRVA